MFVKTRLYRVVKALAQLDEDLVWLDTVDSDEFKAQFVAWIHEQLQRGEDGDGDIMGLYSAATEAINPEKVEGTPYTLKDTGDFYNSMFLVAMVDELILEAEADKDEDVNLYEEYGNAITKLNDENFELLKERVKEGYKAYIRRLLSITR
jgi:hypothetical protein